MASWETELLDAVLTSDLSIAKAILARDEVIKNGDLGRNNWKENEEAPLHQASFDGKDEMVRLLVKSGFDVDSYRDYGDGSRATSLHRAVYNNNASTVRLLLSLGADCGLEGTGGVYCGTPQDWARQRGRGFLIKIFEEHTGKPALPTSLSSFDKMDPMAKLIQKPKKLQDLEEAKILKSEIGDLKIQINKLQDKIVKEEEETRRDKEILGVLAGELRKHETNPNVVYMATLEQQVEEIESIALSLRGLVLPKQSNVYDTEFMCPVCFHSPQQVFSCQECGNWVCQDCKGQLVTCPTCRQELETKPLMRNMAVERMLRDK